MPSYPYNARLKREYREMFDAAVIRSDKVGATAACVDNILANRSRYEAIAAGVGCPWWFVGLIHGMEISFRIGWLANGDPLTGKTVRVPKGLVVPNRVPPYDFAEAGIVSLKHAGLDTIRDWSLEHCLYQLEKYNGFGYRSHGDNSDYLWSFTNFEKAGRYTEDGNWNPTAWSNQVGCVAMLKGLMARGAVSLEASPVDPGIDQLVGWFEAFRLDQDGRVVTGLAAMQGSQARATWTGTDVDSLIAFRKRFPNAGTILVASADKAWPGEIALPPPPSPVPPSEEIYLRVTRNAPGRRNADGLEELTLVLEGTTERSWNVQSGVPGSAKQTFEIGGRDSGSGTGYPCPQGEYFVRDFKWADGKKDNWEGSQGVGLGPLFVPFDPKFETRRGAFGFHWDSNHPQNVRATRESPFAGSAGCLVFRDLSELKRFAAALRKYDPRRLSVQWGL